MHKPKDNALFRAVGPLANSQTVQKLAKNVPQAVIRLLYMGLAGEGITRTKQGVKIIEKTIRITQLINQNFMEAKSFDILIAERLNKMIEQSPEKQNNKQIWGRVENTLKNNLDFLKPGQIQYLVQFLLKSYSALRPGANKQASFIEQSICFQAPQNARNEKQHIPENYHFGSALNKNQREQFYMDKIQELENKIETLQLDRSFQKKLLQQSATALREKDQKIQNLRSTVAKLQAHIIKQVKTLAEKQPKKVYFEDVTVPQHQHHKCKTICSSNQSSMIKSQALEREVVTLKAQIMNLRYDLSKSVQAASLKQKKLLKYSGRLERESEFERQRRSQFEALSREYAMVKKQIDEIVESRKSTRQQYSLNESSLFQTNWQSQSECTARLRAQLNFAAHKYENLEKQHREAVKQLKTMQEFRFKAKNGSLMRSGQESDFGSGPMDCRCLAAVNTCKTLKNHRESAEQLQASKQNCIIRVVSYTEMPAPAAPRLTDSLRLEQLANPAELMEKIEDFDYKASIVYRIGSSKFIESLAAKLSFIMQYACVLELYFSKRFLSSLREEVMMEEKVKVRNVAPADLNQKYLEGKIDMSTSLSNQIRNGRPVTKNLGLNHQFQLNLVSKSDDLIKK